MGLDRVLSGSLDFLCLAEILQLLNANGTSGILVLKSQYASEPGVFYFHEGNPINAVCPDKKGVDAAYALFGWTEGEFEFARRDVKTERIIRQGVMELILDGLRMLDDGQIERLGPEEFEFEVVDELAVEDEFAYLPLVKRPVSNYGYVVNEEEIQAGEYIIKEGMHGNWISLVLEGSADIIKNTPKGEVRVCRLGSGSFVGNISSMLSKSSVRDASLIAATDTTLGVLDLQRIHSEFALVSREMRQLAISLDQRLKRLTDRVMEMYLGQLKPEEFVKDRKPVLPQGKEGEGLFEITGGSVSIVRKTKKGVRPFFLLGKGDLVGHVPFVNIGHEPHNAIVLGTEDCQLKPVDVEALTQEHQSVSSMIRGILDHIATCLSVTTSIACDISKIRPKKDSKAK